MSNYSEISQKTQKPHGKSKGQSLVEMAIALPVIIVLFSGMIEFGFILNYYLSLLDATREAARFYSNQDPFNADLTDNMAFYQGAADLVLDNLQPYDPSRPELDTSRKIILNSATDDIIVSVFDVRGPGNVTRNPISGDYKWFNNMESGISTADISSQLVSGAPNKLILLVEVYYAYHPFMDFVVPDPVMLHAYTMMPMPEITEGTH